MWSRACLTASAPPIRAGLACSSHTRSAGVAPNPSAPAPCCSKHRPRLCHHLFSCSLRGCSLGMSQGSLPWGIAIAAAGVVVVRMPRQHLPVPSRTVLAEHRGLPRRDGPRPERDVKALALRPQPPPHKSCGQRCTWSMSELGDDGTVDDSKRTIIRPAHDIHHLGLGHRPAELEL